MGTPGSILDLSANLSPPSSGSDRGGTPTGLLWLRVHTITAGKSPNDAY